jgi:acyl-coenzyme A thioesterase PaaI-like protein
MRNYTDLFQSARVFRWMMNLWPPLWGQGIRIQYISSDFREIRTRLVFRWYNRGNPGTQFGGALFSMTDPFYSIMLLKNLGDGFTVWDQAATIAFLRPAREPVEACFLLRDKDIQTVHQQTLQGESCSLEFPVAINTLSGTRVASVTRTLHIRRLPEVGSQDTPCAE